MDFDEFLSEYMTEDELEEITVSMVYEALVVRAIAEKEGLLVTDQNYEEEAEALAVEYGYDSLESLKEDYNQASIVNMIEREKVVDFLYDSAEVTEVSEEEYYGEDVTEVE